MAVACVVLSPPSPIAYCFQVVRSTPWTPGGGWGGSRIGRFWGGITVQGLLPYYYEVGSGRTLTTARIFVTILSLSGPL